MEPIMKYDRIFLDLEETIINSWQDQLLVNTQKVKDWLREIGATEVDIFSFAIYNERDQEIFVRQMKPFLERVLEVKINTWPSVIEMAVADTKETGIYWLRDSESLGIVEYINLRGKMYGFINYVRHMYPGLANVVLLDDVVPNTTMSFNDDNQSIHLVNVKKL
jgi:hypothetical protein